MPLDTPVGIVRELTDRGYNVEREAVTLLANAADPERAVERSLARTPDTTVVLSADLVRQALTSESGSSQQDPGSAHISTAAQTQEIHSKTRGTRPETGGSASNGSRGTAERVPDDPPAVTVAKDVTGRSTGTGAYEEFVTVFRDRYERLSSMLRSRVRHRPTTVLGDLSGGSDAGLVGMVSDIRSTANGHWLVELEDTAGTFPTLVTKDKDLAERIDELLLDEVVAVEGRLSDDAGILFVDALYQPDIPRTYQPSTASRPVQAALISDVHVGSHEFLEDAWSQFTDWLHSPEAERVEYLLIAGDMVEGVGIYPGQEDELAIVDIYAQYEAFAEHLKAVPGDLEIVLIPGNHDSVRLAEPQPAFDEDLREIMSAHDARITGNPSVVTIEGVDVLMYHGVSLDEVIAAVPGETYDEPHGAMYQLLRKRHLAPQFGDRTRLAPEDRDYLVIDDVPDVFHAGHVHKLGTGRYHNVTVINSGCWQAQTTFQRRVNIQPDAGYAPILDLDTLDVTIRKFH